MTALDRIEAFATDLTERRRDLHAHPEIGFQEVRTSGLVAERLESWGIEVHRGIGRTGVVGILRGAKGEGRRIGLRADMDALPMEEETNLPWRSRTLGVFHGCGHDGHTTMLLGAARYLAETRDFAGTAVFVFQPAEEGLGGARAMIADGLFERFPCDEIYGMHNSPYHEPGVIGVTPGAAMAAADFFDIRLVGAGSHAAMPERGRDPVVAVGALIGALQSIVSRNAPPSKEAVVSITQVHAGSAYNVIPQEAAIAGTVRSFDTDLATAIRARLEAIARGIGAAYAVEVHCDVRNVFDVLVNDEALSRVMVEAAAGLVGPERAVIKSERVMGSEDFADMLRVVPGAYCTLGHAGDVPLHNPGYVFDDQVLPIGAALMARMVETRGDAGAAS